MANLRALVCPHAGYEYSGPVAAVGYKQLVGRHFSTVMLFGPSHYAAFVGAFVSSADGYQTPLGIVPVSPVAAELAKTSPFSAHPPCRVDRPDWIVLSPRKAPPLGEDTPETWEHSLEVEVPFLQRTLRDCSLVPVVFGDVDPAQVAKKLAALVDDQTLVFASSDLSHYHPVSGSPAARPTNRPAQSAICKAEQLTPNDACGYGPIVTLIELAKRKGWKARLLDYRNSGDTAGDKSRVVGYAAIAFLFARRRAIGGGPGIHAGGAAVSVGLARKAVTPPPTTGKCPMRTPRRRETPRPPRVFRHAHQGRRSAGLHRQRSCRRSRFARR